MNIVPCQIFDHQAFLATYGSKRTRNRHHSRNIIEIATDVRLRDAYQTKDRDG